MDLIDPEVERWLGNVPGTLEAVGELHPETVLDIQTIALSKAHLPKTVAAALIACAFVKNDDWAGYRSAVQHLTEETAHQGLFLYTVYLLG